MYGQHKKTNAEDLLRENQILHEQIADFERLNRVLQTICASQQVNETLQRIIEEAVNICQADQASILLFDPESKASVKTLIREGSLEEEILDHYLNNLLAGWVQEHQSKLLSADLTATFDERLIKAKYRTITSVLSVPFVLHGEIIGILNLVTLRDQNAFGEREAKLMEILSSQCAHFIANAKLQEQLFEETYRLRKELQDKYAFPGIIGKSPAMREVYALLKRIIPTEGRVIIEGESGTGKELIARILHYNGPRKDGPFVAIDCAALPANLLESELFGYVKGAFTGATADKKGLFEEADHGTLFMDEIVDMPSEIQSKFLRAIQENEIRPVGSTKIKKVDVRIVAAASCILTEKVREGAFRQDLYYRLNVIKIKLPSLRERQDDISILAHHFLGKLCKKYEKQIKRFEPETLRLLESYSWPGNVRELENVIERMVILADTNLESIPLELIPPEMKTSFHDSGLEPLEK
ncbi:sigma-54-dependent Fis family transcriptional regulator, partial [candidate division KSB1 bacterium]|nr:sigma-54-dependent Fis family transcriptional regulator [candidate division KSB1 bacterium]NIS27818.1 sigma-54-dependent Fis family transcriptional regulator [candidate division KSB1 bacterium]NIT74700.1 sigma-54-dependent Fis family transcriptional regulator [candidate division KSB1 bacterium]NIU24242.1 sigma-54-dependent Fis family transcriptional regulator [candidate division KSB1 bacterium]NIU93829.1 GAF domain-containing protein [candidate division KSB1 bacterium]